jgi:uncharacterized protein (TIGR02996 family)
MAKRGRPKRGNGGKGVRRLSVEEQAFVTAIVNDPRDRLTRLVYADWMDENSDPRGEYLRLLCEVAQLEESDGREQRVGRLQQLRANFDGNWLASMQRGLGWRILLEVNMLPFEEREYGERYQFGAPANAEQLAEAEAALGRRLPDDLRELLQEFNGVWYTTTAHRQLGYAPAIVYLDLHHMTVEAQVYHEFFPNILCFREVNGFGYVWAVCLQDTADFRAGNVVGIDHEVGKLEYDSPTLFDFVRCGE